MESNAEPPLRAALTLAGACGNRTHPGGCSPSVPVLKTGRHTSTHLLPYSILEESKGKGPEPPGQQSVPVGLSHLNVHVQTAEVALPDGDASAVTGFQKQQGVLPGGSQRIPQLSQCDGAMGGALSL